MSWSAIRDRIKEKSQGKVVRTLQAIRIFYKKASQRKELPLGFESESFTPEQQIAVPTPSTESVPKASPMPTGLKSSIIEKMRNRSRTELQTPAPEPEQNPEWGFDPREIT